MRFTVIINNKGDNTLLNEHGFSLFVENKNFNILFDTGKSEKTFDNFIKLKKRVKNIDYIVISHGHYDHIGGLYKFLSSNPKINIILSDKIFIPKYKKVEDRYIFIGSPVVYENFLEIGGRFIFFQKYLRLNNSFFITHILERNRKEEEYFYIKKGEDFLPDYFEDEIILIIKKDDKINIISGCTHNGLKSIIDTAITVTGIKKINSIIGGFHLSKLSDNKIRDIALSIKDYEIKNIYTYHCTGENGYKILKENLKRVNIYSGNTGDIIEI